MKKEMMNYEAPQVMVFEYVTEGVFCTSSDSGKGSNEDVPTIIGEW